MIIAHSYQRGHRCIYDFKLKKWLYVDNKKIFDDSRPCTRCGQYPTIEGYDACLGYIEGAIAACCGHGVNKPYVLKEAK